jgi:hypothetical protein
MAIQLLKESYLDKTTETEIILVTAAEITKHYKILHFQDMMKFLAGL